MQLTAIGEKILTSMQSIANGRGPIAERADKIGGPRYRPERRFVMSIATNGLTAPELGKTVAAQALA